MDALRVKSSHLFSIHTFPAFRTAGICWGMFKLSFGEGGVTSRPRRQCVSVTRWDRQKSHQEVTSHIYFNYYFFFTMGGKETTQREEVNPTQKGPTSRRIELATTTHEASAQTTAPPCQPQSDVITQSACSYPLKKRSSCLLSPNHLLLCEQENVSEAKQIWGNQDHRQN